MLSPKHCGLIFYSVQRLLLASWFLPHTLVFRVSWAIVSGRLPWSLQDRKQGFPIYLNKDTVLDKTEWPAAASTTETIFMASLPVQTWREAAWLVLRCLYAYLSSVAWPYPVESSQAAASLASSVSLESVKLVWAMPAMPTVTIQAWLYVWITVPCWSGWSHS